MTAISFFRDLAAFSVQIAIVVAVVAGVLRVVRIPARARYFCLRLTLLACLVVPWTLRSVVVVTEAPAGAAARETRVPPASAASAALAPAQTSPTVTGQRRALADLPWTTVGLVALLAGVTARVIWLAIGFFRLGQLTRRAVPIESAEYATVQEQLGTAATISEVDRLAQPVTFGFRRPMVLLPDSLAAAPPPLRRAVVTHELFHVRRGDWLSLLGEEAVRTVFWFHPAIHWLTSSIQLAREEVVDELTVQATGDRRAYIQALLAFADTGGLQPAPAFAHRRQLFHRILSVSKEKVMSAPRIVMSIAALAVAVSSASWYSTSAFPIVRASRVEVPSLTVSLIDGSARADGGLISEPQAVVVAAAWQRAAAAGDRDEPNEVTPENPIPRRMRGVSPAWPSQFAGRQVEVVVNTLVRISRDGAVTNVFDKGCSVHRGDAACSPFFEAAATAIRQWRYARPLRGPLQFSVVVTFRPGAEATVVQSPSEWASYLRETQDSLRLLAQETGGIAIVNQDDFERALRAAAEEQASAEATGRRLTELSNGLRELERALRLALERGPANPDLLKLHQDLAGMNDQIARVQQQLLNELLKQQPQRERAEQWLRTNLARQLSLDADRLRSAVEQLLDAERRLEVNRARAPLVSTSGRTPIRVSDTPGVKPPTPTKRVNPEHPLPAMQARVAGTVVLEVLVDEQGRVADARVIKSIPLLDRAAVDAARQWEFTPTLLDGQPVPVLVTLEMNFTLK